MIRLLLVDDHEMMLEGLRATLSREDDLEVVATADGVGLALDRYRALRPDVVVTDYWLGGATGADLTRAVISEDPEARIVGLSALGTAHTMNDLVVAGCSAFVAKSQGVTALVAAIRAASSGAVLFPKALMQDVSGSGRDASQELTGREREVLALLAEGQNVAAIASALYLSASTVRNHIREILRKLGVSSQLAAVVEATRQGIIPGLGPVA